jgi:hypothetical protein
LAFLNTSCEKDSKISRLLSFERPIFLSLFHPSYSPALRLLAYKPLPQPSVNSANLAEY